MLAQPQTPKRLSWRIQPSEFKVVALRECCVDDPLADNPQLIADFWRAHIETAQWYRPEVECFCVIMLNTRRRIIGFNLVSIGTQDTCLVHPREVFRLACIAAANTIVVAHNHPSGDPMPSEEDIKVTRDLVRAGRLMAIDLLDHLILGKRCEALRQDWVSLRELGYFYDSPPASPAKSERRVAHKRATRAPALAAK